MGVLVRSKRSAILSKCASVAIAWAACHGCHDAGSQHNPSSLPHNRKASKQKGLAIQISNYNHDIDAYRIIRGRWIVTKITIGSDVYQGNEAVDNPYCNYIDFLSSAPDDLHSRCDIIVASFDSLAKPKKLTGSVAGGEIATTPVVGIYEVDGNILHIRLSYSSVSFPTNFTSDAASPDAILECRRLINP